jgi:hypothetical protein
VLVDGELVCRMTRVPMEKITECPLGKPGRERRVKGYDDVQSMQK